MPTDKVIQQLNARVGIPDAVRFDRGEGGLIRATLTHDGAVAQVYSLGAHVAHYQPADGQPVIFMSGASRFAEGEPIRGGVPVCFPWFANHPDDPSLPLHGLVRQVSWKIQDVSQDEHGVSIDYVFRDNGRTRQVWPHAFVANMHVTLSDTLMQRLRIKHRGTPESEPFAFDSALHTYLAVNDVRDVSIAGLEGATYIDKTDNLARKQQGDKPIRIESETDRIYIKSPSACTVDDPNNQRRIVIEKTGSDATVVWNPWIDKAKAMPDFGDDEWPNMVCVETCNVADHRVTLEPGQTHEMSATIRVERV